MKADQNVFGGAHFTKQLYILEGPCHATKRDRCGCQSADRMSIVLNQACSGLVNAGQHIHHGALARSVRSDQAMYRALAHFQINPVERLQTTELHQDLLDLEQGCAIFLGGSGGNDCGYLAVDRLLL